MTTIKTVTHGERVGTVFFDDEWDAYGWATDDEANGPYDSAAEAEDALLDELAAVEPDEAVKAKLRSLMARYFGAPR